MWIGIETGEAKGPEPQKSIQLHRVETLGQTFSALLILTFFTTAALFWQRQLQNIPELFSNSTLTTRTSSPLFLLRNDVAQACLNCTSAFFQKPAPTLPTLFCVYTCVYTTSVNCTGRIRGGLRHHFGVRHTRCAASALRIYFGSFKPRSSTSTAGQIHLTSARG